MYMPAISARSGFAAIPFAPALVRFVGIPSFNASVQRASQRRTQREI
jgi:hypothetical protein